MIVETVVPESAAISTEISVCPVSFAAILDAPNAESLLCTYAEECFDSDAKPQRAMYETMEKAGVIQCFAAYALPGNLLVGFVSVLTAIMPHNGRRIAVGESIFVDSRYRNTGAGNSLLLAAEQYATKAECKVLTWLPRIGSAFDKVLSRRPGYALTHSQYTRWLT